MKRTGTAIPVGALRTSDSCGSGEFLDLIPFADFCKKAGLTVIQLLPVNDTGTESSPYSALSAFALHPLYMSIRALPELAAKEEGAVLSPEQARLLSAEKALHDRYEPLPRFPYRALRDEKLALLSDVFDTLVWNGGKLSAPLRKQLDKWTAANPWIKEYAVFMQLKHQYHEASWKEWPKYRKINEKKLDELWADDRLRKEHLFYTWMQLRLSEQFRQATTYVSKLNIYLKGDIPIMMNEDSHDVWAHPDLFNMNLRAGSPVDGPNPVGQNWGFPTYSWKKLKATGYDWWVRRLQAAASYYRMYRLDHILGFFRIWSIPDTECTAVLGHTEPYEGITIEELHELGFTDERIRWLSKPHIPTQLIVDANKGDYAGAHQLLKTVADRIGNEELWLFKADIAGDKDLWAHDDIPLAVREKLVEKWRDRMLMQTGPDDYYPVWTYGDSTAWKSLSDGEKDAVRALFSQKQLKMEYLWEKQAREIFEVFSKATDMIPCAEDLGASIDSLPLVLDDFGIASLRVIRWSRLWQKGGQPYIPLGDYPEKSVATSSVHDSSTLRIWWTEEKDAEDFYRTFPPEDQDIEPGIYTPKTAAYILGTIAGAGSEWCIHPIQDFLGLSENYTPEKPEDERINLPGSVNEFNWTYRLPVTVEMLQKDAAFISAVKETVSLRKKKK